MTDAERALRGEIVRTCHAMGAAGINRGTSGNVSARWDGGMLVTPSGLPYATMGPEDVVFVAMDGTPQGRHAPSSEWRFHRDILAARDDVGAVVHAHPIHATAWAMLREDVPAVHYMIAAAGGPTIRCAPYATFGTQALSDAALAALKGRMACLLANHGMIACGATLPKALALAVEVETLCHQYAVARTLGTPALLDDAEVARNVDLFAGYGPNRRGG